MAIVLSDHAVERMEERGISLKVVKWALENGVVNKSGQEYVSCADVNGHSQVHVVWALDWDENVVVVSVYVRGKLDKQAQEAA